MAHLTDPHDHLRLAFHNILHRQPCIWWEILPYQIDIHISIHNSVRILSSLAFNLIFFDQAAISHNLFRLSYEEETQRRYCHHTWCELERALPSPWVWVWGRENMTPNMRVGMVQDLVAGLGWLAAGRVSLLQHFSVQGIDTIVITTSYSLLSPRLSQDSVTSMCWDYFIDMLHTVCILLKSNVSGKGIGVTEHVGWLIRLLFIEAIQISRQSTRNVIVNNSWEWMEMYHNLWAFLIAARVNKREKRVSNSSKTACKSFFEVLSAPAYYTLPLTTATQSMSGDLCTSKQLLVVKYCLLVPLINYC